MGLERWQKPPLPEIELVDPPAGIPRSYRGLRALTIFATAATGVFVVLVAEPPPMQLPDGSAKPRPHVFEGIQRWFFRELSEVGLGDLFARKRAETRPEAIQPGTLTSEADTR
jgi:hypothetical protein